MIFQDSSDYSYLNYHDYWNWLYWMPSPISVGFPTKAAEPLAYLAYSLLRSTIFCMIFMKSVTPRNNYFAFGLFPCFFLFVCLCVLFFWQPLAVYGSQLDECDACFCCFTMSKCLLPAVSRFNGFKFVFESLPQFNLFSWIMKNWKWMFTIKTMNQSPKREFIEK